MSGPTLTLAATCDGCRWLRVEEKVSANVYHCGEPTMLKVHPFGVKPKKIGRKPVTPSWCPLLPAARQALAVAEAIAGPVVGVGGVGCERLTGKAWIARNECRWACMPERREEDEAPR